MRTRMRFTVGCLLAAALAGCGSDGADDVGDPDVGDSVTDVDEPADDERRPVDGDWLVEELTLAGQRLELDPSWPITMSVDGDDISGTAACNLYSGTVEVSFDAGFGRFVVSDLSWTEMGCEPPVMEIEQAFLTALQAVDSYEAADGIYVAETGVGTNFHLAPADSVPPPHTTATHTTDTTDEPTVPAPTSEGLARGGGLDGPVMYAAQTEDGQGQMAAEIIGTLELDGDCLYTAFDGNRYPVLWPYGTTWDDDAAAVVLADGTEFVIGGEVYGGGGYLYPDTIGELTTDEAVLERAEQCAEGPYFEVAVLQST